MKPIRIAIAGLAVAIAAVVAVSVVWDRGFEYSEPMHQTAPEEAHTAVFLGNSHTRFHDLPKMIERISESDEDHPPIRTRQRGPGSWTLMHHLDEGVAETKISRHQPDFVVMQGQSIAPLVFPDRYRAGAQEIAELAREGGAEPIIYQTWPRAPGEWTYDEPETPDTIGEAYAQIEVVTGWVAEETDSRLAAVGRAWEIVRHSELEMNLYADDGNHANPNGGYLAALVIYGTIVEDSLPDEPWRPSEISEEHAEQLRDVADQL